SFEEPRVANGNFYIGPVPGWTITGNNGEIQRGILGLTTTNGDQWMELDAAANVTISQDIPTVGGKRYRIVYRGANRPGDTGSKIEVLWNGALVGSSTPTSGFNRVITLEAVATGTVSRVAFRAAGTSDGYGDLIDGIEVYAIDVPGSNIGYHYFIP